MRFNKPAGGERVRLTYINNVDLSTHQVCGGKGVNVPPQRAASFHSRILSHSRCQRSEGDVGVGRRLFLMRAFFLFGSAGRGGGGCRERVVSITPPPPFPNCNPFISSVFWPNRLKSAHITLCVFALLDGD